MEEGESKENLGQFFQEKETAESLWPSFNSPEQRHKSFSRSKFLYQVSPSKGEAWGGAGSGNGAVQLGPNPELAARDSGGFVLTGCACAKVRHSSMWIVDCLKSL